MVKARVDDSTATRAVWDLLRTVPDPEIPVINLVDLNVVTDVVVDGSDVRITLRPTFSGCPALQHMKAEVERVISENGYRVQVTIDHLKSWSTDELGADVKRKLTSIGIAPPPLRGGNLAVTLELPVACPHCGASSTVLDSTFGSTLCKQIFFCNSCRQSFDRFKPL